MGVLLLHPQIMRSSPPTVEGRTRRFEIMENHCLLVCTGNHHSRILLWCRISSIHSRLCCLPFFGLSLHRKGCTLTPRIVNYSQRAAKTRGGASNARSPAGAFAAGGHARLGGSSCGGGGVVVVDLETQIWLLLGNILHFSYCGLVGNPHLTAKTETFAPLPTSTKQSRP